jgi:hypothetical protein
MSDLSAARTRLTGTLPTRYCQTFGTFHREAASLSRAELEADARGNYNQEREIPPGLPPESTCLTGCTGKRRVLLAYSKVLYKSFSGPVSAPASPAGTLEGYFPAFLKKRQNRLCQFVSSKSG